MNDVTQQKPCKGCQLYQRLIAWAYRAKDELTEVTLRQAWQRHLATAKQHAEAK